MAVGSSTDTIPFPTQGGIPAFRLSPGAVPPLSLPPLWAGAAGFRPHPPAFSLEQLPCAEDPQLLHLSLRGIYTLPEQFRGSALHPLQFFSPAASPRMRCSITVLVSGTAQG